MSKITADTTLKELSGIVASALEEAGIVARGRHFGRGD